MTLEGILILIRQGIISGVGSGVSSFAIGRILSAIFGTSNPDAAILAQIESQIQTLLTAVQQLAQDIEQLQTQLAIDVTTIEGYIDQASIAEDIAAIEQHYLDLGTMAHDAANNIQLPYTQQQFHDNVLGTWDIPTHVLAILEALVGNAGLNEGLLNVWTDYLIQTLGSSSTDDQLFQAYMLLEGWFHDQMQHVMKGIVQVSSVMCSSLPPSQPCPDGQGYLQQVDAPMQTAVQLFIASVERVVVSRMSVRAAAPQPAIPANANQIFARADLLGALLLGATPGLTGRAFVQQRFVDLSAQTGPSLQPTTAFAASPGTVVQVPQTSLGQVWPLCAEISDGPTIGAYGSSTMQIVRYVWPWPVPAPTAGVPLDVSPQFKTAPYAQVINVTPQFYDPSTLAPDADQQNPQPGAVLYANFFDASGLTQDLSVLSEWVWQPPGPAGSPWDQFVTLTTPFQSFPLYTGLQLQFTLPGQYQWPEAPAASYGGQSSTTYSYAGSDTPVLYWIVGYTATLSGESGTTTWSQQANWVTAQLAFGPDVVAFGVDFPEVFLYAQSTTSAGTAQQAVAQGQAPLDAQGAFTITYSILLDPLTGQPYIQFPSNGMSGAATVTIDYIRLSW